MNYLSQFSGIGTGEKGIDQAYENFAHKQVGKYGGQGVGGGSQVGRKPQLPNCIGICEIDPFASAIHRYNYPGVTNYGDATKLIPESLPDFEFLIAGFPCQTFSIAGKRAGFEDTRGTLFFEIARVLSHKRPAHFLLENVKGILSHDGGKTMHTILGVLARLDYFVEVVLLNSKDFGVPQNRERVFFIGHFAGECAGEILSFGKGNGVFTAEDFGQPREAISSTVRPGMSGIPGNSETYIIGKDGKPKNKTVASTLTGGGHLGGNHSDMDLIQIGHLSSNAEAHRVYSSEGLARTIKFGGGMGAKTGLYQVNDSKESGGKQPFQQNRIYDENGIAPAHQANLSSGSYAVETKSRIRRLTPNECEFLQGLPADWTKYGNFDGEVKEISDTQRYRGLGNAFTVPVISALITQLLEKKCLS
jgi:DNA (cytosine-5)-methyltransferase 1